MARIGYARELLSAVLAQSRHSRKTVRRWPAMPVLRRTHDCHRDIQTLEAAERTAKYGGNEPGECAMTRHGSLTPRMGGFRTSDASEILRCSGRSGRLLNFLKAASPLGSLQCPK